MPDDFTGLIQVNTMGDKDSGKGMPQGVELETLQSSFLQIENKFCRNTLATD